MKNRTQKCLTALALAGFLTAGLASAQTETTTSSTSTTQSAGTISQFSPDAIVIKTTTSATPVSYTSSKTTTYVDQNGNTVSSETVKSGAPVTVYYTKDGDKLVASKVVVQRTTTSTEAPVAPAVETKKTSTTTTTSGQ